MRLSKNFTLAELVSSQHTELVSTIRQIPPQALVMVVRLVHEFLQPVRDEFGPTVITSGYRSHALNMTVGGSHSSRHMGITQDGLFAAADFFLSDVKAADAFEHIGETSARFDRLCLYESRLHVDISHRESRGLLYIDRGRGQGWVKQ